MENDWLGEAVLWKMVQSTALGQAGNRQQRQKQAQLKMTVWILTIPHVTPSFKGVVQHVGRCRFQNLLEEKYQNFNKKWTNEFSKVRTLLLEQNKQMVLFL